MAWKFKLVGLLLATMQTIISAHIGYACRLHILYEFKVNGYSLSSFLIPLPFVSNNISNSSNYIYFKISWSRPEVIYNTIAVSNTR